MARIVTITDIGAPELDVYARLTQAQLRSRLEPEKGVFIAESVKAIDVALRAGCRPVSLLMEERHLHGQGAALAERCGDVPVYTAPREVLRALTGYTVNRGVLCAMARPAPRQPEDVMAGAARLAVLEAITDTTNMGAIFRSAAALGMDGVLLSPTCCDPLSRRSVRVSMGTVLQVPWAVLDGWPAGGLALLRENGFATVALALDERALDIDDPVLASLPKIAAVLGTEGDGLSPAAITACDYTARIPMANGVDSLNVAAAGAVAFWQLRRR